MSRFTTQRAYQLHLTPETLSFLHTFGIFSLILEAQYTYQVLQPRYEVFVAINRSAFTWEDLQSKGQPLNSVMPRKLKITLQFGELALCLQSG